MHDANEYRDHLGFNLIDGDKSMMIVVGDGCREREKKKEEKERDETFCIERIYPVYGSSINHVRRHPTEHP